MPSVETVSVRLEAAYLGHLENPAVCRGVDFSPWDGEIPPGRRDCVQERLRNHRPSPDKTYGKVSHRGNAGGDGARTTTRSNSCGCSLENNRSKQPTVDARSTWQSYLTHDRNIHVKGSLLSLAPADGGWGGTLRTIEAAAPYRPRERLLEMRGERVRTCVDADGGGRFGGSWNVSRVDREAKGRMRSES
jgi:hypothetical protein